MLYHDLLRRIFELMDNQPGEYIKPRQASAVNTWASTALVCRQWTLPAQSALYARVFITIMSNPERNARAILFARTMHTAPHLRALLKHFSLTVKGVAVLPPELVDWVAHVPEGSLLSLESSLEHRPQPAQLALYAAPAIRGLRALTLRGHHPRELLTALGALPRLEALTIQFDDLVKKADTWAGVQLALPPTVRTVRIDACTERYLLPAVDLIRRAAAAPHVRVLKLRLVDPVVHAGAPAIAQALLQVSPHLWELRLSSVPWAPQVQLPFVDELVLRAPALERLDCVLGTFSDALFARLPASVRDFRIALWGAEFFPHEAGLANLLERVGQGGMALTEMEIFAKSAAVRSQLAGLGDACARRGVTLRWTE
ncbi:hypothetical protein GSI_05752 [Ganoderma sinense ZZ0214-1]|uniref:F-box domain-containing protein n=1 Tax=Ganoderma sinense ZZ0214-1 TaxID=1077348 RepID=A0A2G8SBB7_9APHY|nr:hypothetical protein GSI_05752 [Ganoderma sinense ZZ0214-1]